MYAQRMESRVRPAPSFRRAACLVAVLLSAVPGSPARADESEAPEKKAGAGAGEGLGTPTVQLGGQYRINAYSAENDVVGEDAQTASRVRIRQNVDMRFDERFRTHVQLELGHTPSNVDTTSVRIGIRHAVLDYTAENGLNLQAGIVPLGDRFGDVLFSSDWNYNPVAASLTIPAGPAKIRAFAGTLLESKANGATITGGEAVSDDDTTHYQLDVAVPLGRVQLDAGGTYVRFSPDVVAPFRARDHFNYGLGARVSVARDLAVHAFVLGSKTDGAILAAGNGDGSGVAAKLELTGKAGPGKFGLLATHATGEDNGSGFIPVQAVVATNGYWGYTGILTVQGPTDTGFDADSVNVSNNGYGLTSVQARFSMPIVGDLSGYAAAGWFGNASAPAGRSGDVGVDVLVMATYRFNRVLALDVGGAFARIEDSTSGYDKGVTGAFNQDPGITREKTAVVARMQAEF